MQTLDDLQTPALIVDLDRLESNVLAMAGRASELGVRLRPHVKAHKCVEIGRLQLAAGGSGITVATLYEAEVFATAGFDDITWAFPVIPSRIPQAAALAERVRLGVVVDCEEAADALRANGHPFRVWVKVDCGYHRAGVDPASDAAARLVDRIESSGMSFAGLLSHSGNAYDHDSVDGRARIAEEERERMVDLAERLRAAGRRVEDVSVGSTPGMTAVRTLAGVTEARPGNYAYFDLMQVRLGCCTVADCALTVLATVVSRSAGHAVIDAGALALSKDAGTPPATMGEVFADYASSELHRDLRVHSLSQEHGKLTGALPFGERLRILPNHSCLTAACFTSCYAVRGEEVVERWRVWNGR